MGRGSANTGWELCQQPGGAFYVRLDGRIVQHDCEDLDAAVQFVRSHRNFRAGERGMTVVETDGYRYGLVR